MNSHQRRKARRAGLDVPRTMILNWPRLPSKATIAKRLDAMLKNGGLVDLKAQPYQHAPRDDGTGKKR